MAKTFLVLVVTALPISARAARMELDAASAASISAGKPIFSNFYYEPRKFSGDFSKTQTLLAEFYARRAAYRTQLEVDTDAKLQKLVAENRRMLSTRGDTGEDTTVDSKWGLALYDNIADQATVRQNSLDALAAWDRKNWVEVESAREGDKQFLSAVRIHREGETPTALAAQ